VERHGRRGLAGLGVTRRGTARQGRRTGLAALFLLVIMVLGLILALAVPLAAE
jgi:hypothetical protein